MTASASSKVYTIRGHLLEWGPFTLTAKCTACGDVVSREAIYEIKHGHEPEGGLAVRVCPALSRGVTRQ